MEADGKTMKATLSPGEDGGSTVRLMDGTGMGFAPYSMAIRIASEFGDIDCRVTTHPKTKVTESFVEFTVSSKAQIDVPGKLRRALTRESIEIVSDTIVQPEEE